MARSNSILITCMLVIATLLLAACSDETNAKKSNQTQWLVKPKHWQNNLFYSSKIEPLSTYNVTIPVDATINKRFFNYGETIKKGQVLFSFRSQQLENDYAQALAEYLKAKNNLAIAKNKFANSENLWKLKIISHDDYISEKSSLDNANVSYLQALKQLVSILKKAQQIDVDDVVGLTISDQEKVEQALNKDFSHLTIKAPINGVALQPSKSNSDESSTGDSNVTAGDQVKVGQTLAVIGDLKGLSVKISVAEVDLDKVKMGAGATITGVGFPAISLHGKVSSIAEQAVPDPQSELAKFAAVVEVNKIPAKLKQKIHVGMSAKVQINQLDENIISIPIKALTQKNGKDGVLLKVDGKSIWQQLKLGASSKGQVVVTKGLKFGDVIVFPNKQA